MWGKKVKMTNVATKLTKALEIANLCKYVRQHVNYHSSMTYDSLVGIVMLDLPVPFYSVTDAKKLLGSMTLRHVLYNYVKLADGHSLFGEIHQENGMLSVDVIVLNTSNAETMLLMMNKQLAAYLQFYLQDIKIETNFAQLLVKTCICPTLLHEVSKCTWDKVTKVLTNPEDIEATKTHSIGNTAWYKDEFGSHMQEKGKQQKKSYAASDMVYDLGGEHSVKTIHERADTGYTSTPGAPTLQLGRDIPSSETVVIDDNSMSNISVLSNLSKENLLSCLKNEQGSLLRQPALHRTSKEVRNLLPLTKVSQTHLQTQIAAAAARVDQSRQMTDSCHQLLSYLHKESTAPSNK